MVPLQPINTTTSAGSELLEIGVRSHHLQHCERVSNAPRRRLQPSDITAEPLFERTAFLARGHHEPNICRKSFPSLPLVLIITPIIISFRFYSAILHETEKSIRNALLQLWVLEAGMAILVIPRRWCLRSLNRFTDGSSTFDIALRSRQCKTPSHTAVH